MKIYFDTNIWIDYLWGKYEGRQIKKQTQTLIEFVERENYTVVASVFLFTEISNHFKDWYILKKIIKAGYSYRELGNLKKDKKYNRLTKRQTDRITEILEEAANFKWVDSIELKNLDKNALDLFSNLTLKYYMDFADAFHLIVAMGENCRYLITKDGSMRDKTLLFLKDFSLEKEFTIYGIEEFLNQVQ